MEVRGVRAAHGSRLRLVSEETLRAVQRLAFAEVNMWLFTLVLKGIYHYWK